MSGPVPQAAHRMRVLITGGAGFVGAALVATRPSAVAVTATWRSTEPSERHRGDGVDRQGVEWRRVELTDRAAVDALLGQVSPEVVIHTAYSADSRADIVDATRNVADACARFGAALVHLSTDVVFGGDDPPYREGDLRGPVNDYGRWKCEAEDAVSALVPEACITRTSLVVGLDPPDPATSWLLDAVGEGRDVALFHDEIRSPIRIDDLSAQLWQLTSMSDGERRGVWHLPGPEALSRLEIGHRLCDAAGVTSRTIRSASARSHPAPRPRDLTLTSERTAMLSPVAPIGTV